MLAECLQKTGRLKSGATAPDRNTKYWHKQSLSQTAGWDLRGAVENFTAYLYKEGQHSQTIWSFLGFCHIWNIFSYMDDVKLEHNSQGQLFAPSDLPWGTSQEVLWAGSPNSRAGVKSMTHTQSHLPPWGISLHLCCALSQGCFVAAVGLPSANGILPPCIFCPDLLLRL